MGLIRDGPYERLSLIRENGPIGEWALSYNGPYQRIGLIRENGLYQAECALSESGPYQRMGIITEFVIIVGCN
jgi:hypothetical protein